MWALLLVKLRENLESLLVETEELVSEFHVILHELRDFLCQLLLFLYEECFAVCLSMDFHYKNYNLIN